MRQQRRQRRGADAITPYRNRYTWDFRARSLFYAADAYAGVGITFFVVGGVGASAAAALHCVAIAPERVRALVLMLLPPCYEARSAAADALLQQAAVEDDAMKAASDPATRRRHLERSAALRGDASSDLPPPEAFLTDTDASKFDIPTLILAAEGAAHPVSTSERLAAALGPMARLVVLRSADEVMRTAAQHHVAPWLRDLGVLARNR